jgi:hypothetical protein
MTPTPPLPPGFVLEGAAPPLPPGFVPEEPPSPVALPQGYREMADFAMGNALAAARAAATPKPPPDRVGENLTGANKGIATILGLPVDIIASTLKSVANSASLPGMDLVNPIGNVVPRLMQMAGMGNITDPMGGSESIKRGMRAVGVPEVEPVDRQGRITSRIAEEVAASLIPTAGLVGKAAQATRMGKVDPTSILAPFASAPVRETANQVALATSAGTGAAASQEVFGQGPVADIAGALFGSQMGSNMARMGGTVSEIAKNVVDPKRMARSDTGARLVDSMVDKTRDVDGRVVSAGDTAFGDRFKRGRELEAEVPGLKLTAGETTTDPGLQALEYQRRSGGPSTGLYEQQRQNNRTAVDSALGEIAPKATSDAATRKALEARAAQATGKASAVVEKRAGEADTAAAAVEPPLSRAEAGEIVRKEIESQLAANRAKERSEWQAADPEGKTAFETGSIKARAQALLDDTPRTEAPTDTPPIVKELAGKADAPAPTGRSIDPELMPEVEKAAAGKALLRETESVDELLALKSRLSTAIREERAADAPTPNRIRKLSIMLDEVTNAISTGASKSAENAAAKEAIDKATATSRELNDRFTRGTAAEVTGVDARGGRKVENSELPGKFFKSGANGTPEALADFERAVGDSTVARSALRSYALDDAKRVAMKDGKVDAKALEGWIAKHKDALDAYPKIREELGSLASAQKALERASRREQLLKDSVADPKKSTVAKYLDREEARSSIGAVMDSKNPRKEMTNLVNSLKGDADALEGARRAFWDRMMDGPATSPKQGVRGAEDARGESIISNDKLKNFMAKYGDQAAILYRDNPEHLKRLEKIAEAVAAGQRTTKIRPPGSSGTPLGTVPGLTLAGLTSRGYAIARGVVSIPYVALETGARAARRSYLKLKNAEVEKLMDEALLNPEVAKTLVMEWNEANQKVIARRLRTHLGHELDVGAEAQVDDEPKKEK